MKPQRWLSVLCAAAIGLGGCAGAGSQGFGAPVGPGTGAGGGLGAVPSGSTVIRVRVPWTASAALPGGRGPSGGLGPAVTPTPVSPFSTPTPIPTMGVPGGAPASPYPAQSLTLALTGPTPVTETIPLVPTGPNCAPATNGSVCQIALPLAAGTYTAVVSAYGSSSGTGSQVGAPQTIGFTVASGGTNVVNLAFGGIPASLAIVPATSLSVVNAQDGIDLYGAGKHQLLVQMLDQNQNVIVGTGAPSYSIAQTGGQMSPALTQPSSTTPNAFAVAAPGSFSGSATLRASAISGPSGLGACAQLSAQCTGTVTVDVKQLLAVANSSANSVTFYTAGSVAPIATIQNGLTNPTGLVFDAAGDLFVANQPGSIAVYAPPYTGVPSTIGIGVNHPQSLALDSRGNLFVANGNGSNTVTEYSAPYSGAPSATISTGVDDPVSLALDATNNLYVVNQAANNVTIYAPPYNDAPVAISNGLSGPNSIAVDPHGNIFVANLNSTPNSVLEYAPPFSSTSIPTAWITNGVNEQGAIAIAGTSNLFVPNQGANTVTEYAPPYTGLPTTITGGQNQPVALAIDAQGNLFVANYGNSTVTEYPPPYGSTSWITIANGIGNPQALALSPATTTNSLNL